MDQQGQNGLMSTFREGWRTRNLTAAALGIFLFAFYVVLYFTEAITPLAHAIGLRNKWFLYGLIYTFVMSGGAVYYLKRHGNSAYNRKRISVNLLIQVLLAFTLPLVMPYFFTANPDDYWKYEASSYFWPLAWYDLHPGTLENKASAIAAWSLAGSFILAPIMAIRYGKRWYCSWVCGCGGLANTFGDPWRHLTSSSKASWKFEKVAVHTVLVLAFLSTGLLVVDHYVGESPMRPYIAGGEWYSVKALYGLVVGSILSGVIGTAVYPVFGPRIWCRNFCPMAAMLGLLQKLGRFRIRVKKDMCISCGNCTTYCEMGIDVRDYAQKNESFTRASCVGCGMCAHVCPRGVLKLENAPKAKKTSLPIVS